MGSNETPEVRFGRFVRRERERMGLSQAELAEQLSQAGIKAYPTTIAKIEARDGDKPRTIRLDEAAALAEIFGRTLDEMLNTPTEVSRSVAVERVLRQVNFLTKSLRKDETELQRELENLSPQSLIEDKAKQGTLDAPYEGWSDVELRAFLLVTLSSDLLRSIGDVYRAAIEMIEIDSTDRDALAQNLAEKMRNVTAEA